MYGDLSNKRELESLWLMNNPEKRNKKFATIIPSVYKNRSASVIIFFCVEAVRWVALDKRTVIKHMLNFMGINNTANGVDCI